MPQRDVLVVDDDAEINELVGAYAGLAGFGYAAALDAASGLRQAIERSPSLIVLDLMLPDASGLDVCRQLKGDDRTAAIPVVMLTALDRDEQRRQLREAGAVAYMIKPFDPDALMDAMRAHALGQAG
jgi:DNA-binding response OmpR family regulator